MANLHERLKQLRTDKKQSQTDVSAECGIALRSLKYYESGERSPNADIIIKLCQFFNVSADYLLGLTDSPLPPGHKYSDNFLSDINQDFIKAYLSKPELRQAIDTLLGLIYNPTPPRKDDKNDD